MNKRVKRRGGKLAFYLLFPIINLCLCRIFEYVKTVGEPAKYDNF
jgi:hypothetical protein